MKINQSLSLNDCLSIMNKMLESVADYDCDSDGVVYILIDPERVDLLKQLIPDEKDLQKYLKDYGEEWEEYGFDITGIWGEVCRRFNVDIWVNFKKRQFYVVKWHHRVHHLLNKKCKAIRYKIEWWKIQFRNKLRRKIKAFR